MTNLVFCVAWTASGLLFLVGGIVTSVQTRQPIDTGWIVAMMLAFILARLSVPRP